jgi:hypothetical protein
MSSRKRRLIVEAVGAVIALALIAVAAVLARWLGS